VFVGVQDVFLAAKRADQHEQRGLWQMEIREHRLDDLEFEPWINEEVRRGGAGADGSCAGPHRVFESPNGSGADGDNPARLAKSLVDGGSGGGGDGIRLRVEFVILDALDVDGLKCSQADVQGNLGGLDPAPADAVEDFRGEMKACGRSGDGTAPIGIDGLVAFAIAG